MQHKTIQIFATDCKKRNGSWDLPFIRVGTTQQCDALIHAIDGDQSFEKFGLPVSEFNAIWRIAEHLEDFGNPDYIGLCHSRRFFTVAAKTGILPIQDERVDNSIILTPYEQLHIMQANGIDILAPFPFLEHYKQDPSNKHYLSEPSDIAEYFYTQLVDDCTGFTIDDIRFALSLLEDNVPDQLKPGIQDAYLKKAVYFGTIFTATRDIFNIWWKVMKKTMIQVLARIGQDRLFDMNCRAAGYLLERLTSCLIWAFAASGKKIASLPLIVSDFSANPVYRKRTAAEAGLPCNIDAMLRSFADML